MVNVSYRNSREGYLADPLTRYSIDHIFNQFFTQSFFHKLVLGEYNIDLDDIYDKCEEKRISFEKTLISISKYLYEQSNPFTKNKLFYKFIHNYGLEILSLIDTVYNNICEIIDINHLIDSENLTESYEIIKNMFLETLNKYSMDCKNIINFDTPTFRLLRIIDDFYFNNIDVYKLLLNNVTDTFNNVIKNCYRIEFDKSTKALDNFLRDQSNNYVSSYIRAFNLTDSTYNNSYNNISNNSLTTSTLSGSIISSRYHELDILNSLKKEPPKKTITNKNTPGIKVLNKSLKVIRKFFPKDKLNFFLKETEVLIEGERFNWGFKLRSRKDLIKYSNNLNSYAIQWDLWVYHKITDQRITRCCITFPESPILDQVLSIYLMIQSGNEINVLKNSGFFEKNERLFKDNIEPILNPLKNKKVGNIFEQIDSSHNRRSNFLRRNICESEVRSLIKNWIKEYFIELGMDKDLWNYTMNLDVSWGEAVDYEAFNLFDVKVFDKWVKPFKWNKDYFRFKNLLLLENNVLNRNIMVSVVKL